MKLTVSCNGLEKLSFLFNKGSSVLLEALAISHYRAHFHADLIESLYLDCWRMADGGLCFEEGIYLYDEGSGPEDDYPDTTRVGCERTYKFEVAK